MVATEDEEVFGIFNLVSEEQTNSLQRLLSTIHVVAEEKIVCFWRESSVLKQSQ